MYNQVEELHFGGKDEDGKIRLVFCRFAHAVGLKSGDGGGFARTTWRASKQFLYKTIYACKYQVFRLYFFLKAVLSEGPYVLAFGNVSLGICISKQVTQAG